MSPIRGNSSPDRRMSPIVFVACRFVFFEYITLLMTPPR